MSIAQKATNKFYDLTVGTGGSATVASPSTNLAAADNLFIQTGATMTTGAHSLSVTSLIYGGGTLDGSSATGSPAISAGSMGTTGGGNALGTLKAPTGANAISVVSDWNVTSYTTNTDTVSFTGTGTIYTSTGFYNLSKTTGGTTTYTAAAALSVANNLVVNTGTLVLADNAATQTVGVNLSGSGTLNASGILGGHVLSVGGYVGTSGNVLATLSAPVGTLNVGSDWDVTAFTSNNGTVAFTATGTIYTSTGFYNLSKTTGGTTTYTAGAALSVANNLVVNTGTLVLADNAATQTVGLNLSGSGTLNASGILGGHVLSVGGYVGTSGNVLATLSAPVGTLNVGTDWDVTAFTSNNGTVAFTGTGTIYTSTGFYNLSKTTGGTTTYTAGAALSVANNLVVNTGTLVLADNAATQTVGLNLSGSGTLNASGILGGHVLSVGGYVGTSGNVLATLSAPVGTLNVGSDWDVTAFTSNNGTVAFTGTGTIYTSTGFYNLSKTTGGTTTYTAGAALSVANNLVVNTGTLVLADNAATQTVGVNLSGSGTLNASGILGGHVLSVGGYVGTSGNVLATLSAPVGTLNVGTDWDVTAFTSNNGTVAFTATGTIYTSTGFYNLSKTTGGTTTYTAAAALSVANNLVVNTGTLVLADNAATQTVGVNLSGSGTLNASGILGGHVLSVGGYVGTSGNVLATLSAPVGTLNVGGDFDVTTFTHNNGTVAFTGTGTIYTSTGFYNLSKTTGGTTTYTAGAALSVANNLVVNTGTLVLADNAATQTVGLNLSGSGTLNASGILGGHVLSVGGYVGTSGNVLATLSAPVGTLNVGSDWDVTAFTPTTARWPSRARAPSTPPRASTT